MNRRRYAYLSTLVLLATSPLAAFAVTDTYTGIDNGFWNDPLNWSAGIPNNGGSAFDVILNTAQTVQLNIYANINTLSLAAPSILSFLPGSTLSLTAGSISNSGTLQINGTGSSAGLLFATDSTLTGAGTLLMTGASSQIFGTTGVRLTTDNLITGQGSLGALKLTNSGTIIASAGSLTIVPVNAADGFINTGTLRADGGKLILAASTYTNTGGIIEAINGSTANITGTVIGGAIRGLGGTVTLSTNSTFSGVAFSGAIAGSGTQGFTGLGSNSGVMQSATLMLDNATINNSGTISLSGSIISTSGASLVGGGMALLTSVGSTIAGVPGGSFENFYSDNFIAGRGVIFNSVNFTNAGTIAAMTGSIAITAGNLTNSGVLRADGANMTITAAANTTFNNTGGIVEAINSKNVALSGNISGGTFRGNGGTVSLSSANLQSATLEGIVSFGGSSTLSGSITNNGTFVMASTVTLAADSTLNGTGNSQLNSAILAASFDGLRLTNYSSISGKGSIGLSGGNALKISNYGTIAATTGAITILHANGTDAFYNYGTIQAADNATVAILSNSFIDNGGTVDAGNSIVTIGNNALVSGALIQLTGTKLHSIGTLTDINGANIEIVGGPLTNITLQDVEMSGAIAITIQSDVNLNGNISLIGTLNTIMVGSRVYNLNGTFNNMGIVKGRSEFSINSNSVLSGGGTITLTNFSSPNNSLLVTDNTIRGTGNLGLGSLRILNTGVVTTFNGFGGSLTISPTNSSDGFINQGTLRADGVPLYLAPSIYTNTSGHIEALNGSLVTINGTVNGGTLLSNGLINFNSSSQVGPISGSGTVSVAAGMSLISDGLTLNTLVVSGTHILRANASWGGTSSLSLLIVASDTSGNWTGKVDVTNNALILLNADTTSKAAALSTIGSQIASGRNGGTWDGNGITSSTVAIDRSATGTHLTTLALVDNAELGAATFRGQNVDSNSLIITQALSADVDLNGSVGFSDLLKVAQDFGQTGGWAFGHITGGGSEAAVNFADLLLVAQDFGQILPLAADAGESTEPVPEPETLGILAMAGALLTRRRPGARRAMAQNRYLRK